MPNGRHIKIIGGTLRLGNNLNESGLIELYDDTNTLICQLDKGGITIFCEDGRKIKINDVIGFVGYDTDGSRMYWVNGDEFHMREGYIESDLTICEKLRFLSITTDTNNGVGVVALV